MIKLLGSSSYEAVQRYRVEILDSAVAPLADIATEWMMRKSKHLTVCDS
jgi:hypothetical protein